MSAGPAEGHHVCSGAKGRLHHQTLARTARQKPTGRAGHRPSWHPFTASVTHTHTHPKPSRTAQHHTLHTSDCSYIQGHLIFFAKKLRNGAQHSRFVFEILKLTLDSAGLRKSQSQPLQLSFSCSSMPF